MANKKIKITQVKSRIGYSRKAKATLDALGLRKINQSVVLDLNDSISVSYTHLTLPTILLV